jgi:hypothetical protein
LWAQIRAIPHPGPLPAIQSIPPKPSESTIKLKDWNTIRKVLAACAAGVPFAILLTDLKLPVFGIVVLSVLACLAVYHLADRSEELNAIRSRVEPGSK